MRASVVFLGAVALAQPLFANPVVQAVTLSTGGVAMIEATGALDADGLTLPIRRADIDDFLKSLRLSDPEGGVPMLTLAGPGGLTDTFATLPFPPEALSDLRRLIDTMTGAPVVLQRRGISTSGVLMGTRDVPCPEREGTCVSVALRGTDGTLRQIALDDGTDLSFADPADQAALDRGLAALRGAARADALAVTLTSTATTEREVTMGWLQPAPLWKTAWRAEETPEGLVLTAWAVIENTTGQDWVDVDLTLATGAVHALQAQLYERVPAARKLAMPDAMPMIAAAPMAREMAFEAAFDVAPASMDNSDSFSSFTLSTPVSLKAGEVLSLPFLRETLPDARLTLYRGGMGAEHPAIALDFANPLPLRLPAGVLTLYTPVGHAGDAQVPELAPGARAQLDFARDTSVAVREDSTSAPARVLEARFVAGVLEVQERLDLTTTYRLEGAATEPRVVTILHPAAPGWEATDPAWTRADLDTLRRDVALDAGARAEVSITESRVSATQIVLNSADDQTLAFWSGRVPDVATRATLGALRDLRTERARLLAESDGLEQLEATLIADQERLVGLIVQLGDDSAANVSRRARVDAIEDQITEARTAREGIAGSLRDLDAQIDTLLR
jgi:hypothetical protein